MIIDKGVIVNYNGFKKYSCDTEGYCCYLKGLVFAENYKEGQETINKIMKEYIESRNVNFNYLFGAYTIIIVDEIHDKIIAFTDNSNMNILYYSINAVSSSFIELINYMKKNNIELTLNKDVVCEYLIVGKRYFQNTVLNEIKLLNSMNYLEVNKGVMNVFDKKIGDIECDSILKDHFHFFEIVKQSLQDNLIYQGLTGGYDSRMIYCALKDNLNINPFIYGNDEEHKDIKIAKKIAKISNANLMRIVNEKVDVNESLIEDMFNYYDGMIPAFNTLRYLVFYFEKTLRKNPEDFIYISGDGGVLHKDWEWIQDFPFYKKKKQNVRKFYYDRILLKRSKDIIGNELYEQKKSFETNFLGKLNQYKKKYNTQSYDCFYYNFNGNRQEAYNVSDEHFRPYAILNELNFVRLSYKLERKKRFFNYNMRVITSKYNKKISRIKTGYGMTASSNPFIMLFDFIAWGWYTFLRGIRYIFRKVTGKTLFSKYTVDFSIDKEIKNLEITAIALEYLKKIEILDKGVEIEELTSRDVATIIYLYKICMMIK